jgi:hypothetical protein
MPLNIFDVDSDDDIYDDIPPPFPVACVRDGDPVPDLDAIPQSEWKDVLAWCEPHVRSRAVATTKTHEDNVAAQWVLYQLGADAHRRREAALADSAPPPAPVVSRAIVRRDTRQVNFRVSDEEHDLLDRAARAYGVSAPRLARMLAIRGAKRALDSR